MVQQSFPSLGLPHLHVSWCHGSPGDERLQSNGVGRALSRSIGKGNAGDMSHAVRNPHLMPLSLYVLSSVSDDVESSGRLPVVVLSHSPLPECKSQKDPVEEMIRFLQHRNLLELRNQCFLLSSTSKKPLCGTLFL